ncbi:MAG: MBL fold metallo-hydrolase [Proteobacteria bacterium]|nr:MBL fold metallo-hydrolase [Pseudomonadota bacterium]
MRLIMLLTAFVAATAMAQEGPPFCGEEGPWIQILGAGGSDLNDGLSGSGYLVWIDNQARLLVDPGPGSSTAFDRSGANFADLDAVVFTHLHADHTADFPAFIQGSYFSERDQPLIVLGPDSSPSLSDQFTDTETFIARLIGPNGAYAHLAEFLTYKSTGGYKINARNVPSTGSRKWARFSSDHFRLSSVPVNHGTVPAIAWRVDMEGYGIVFTGDFSNSKNVMANFAKDVTALVIDHAIPENARGEARDLHVTPSQIGQIAGRAKPNMVILSHRTKRTMGRESQSRALIEDQYEGSVLFANDMECWGL